MRNITSMVPNKKHPHNITLLLKLNEFTEIKHHAWIRKASNKEKLLIEDKLAQNWNVFVLRKDSQGSPYVWVTILKTAPAHIWKQASKFLRLSYFRPND